jgi:hypothetical protein
MRRFQRLALTRIAAEPLRHLRTTPVFFWRIMWPVSPEISFLGMLSIWTVTLVSLIKRQPAMFGAFGLAVGMIAFYVAVSHAIPLFRACRAVNDRDNVSPGRLGSHRGDVYNRCQATQSVDPATRV